MRGLVTLLSPDVQLYLNTHLTEWYKQKGKKRLKGIQRNDLLVRSCFQRFHNLLRTITLKMPQLLDDTSHRIVLSQMRILPVRELLQNFLFLHWAIGKSPFCDLAYCSTKREQLRCKRACGRRICLWPWRPSTGLVLKVEFRECVL